MRSRKGSERRNKGGGLAFQVWSWYTSPGQTAPAATAEPARPHMQICEEGSGKQQACMLLCEALLRSSTAPHALVSWSTTLQDMHGVEHESCDIIMCCMLVKIGLYI